MFPLEIDELLSESFLSSSTRLLDYSSSTIQSLSSTARKYSVKTYGAVKEYISRSETIGALVLISLTMYVSPEAKPLRDNINIIVRYSWNTVRDTISTTVKNYPIASALSAIPSIAAFSVAGLHLLRN